MHTAGGHLTALSGAERLWGIVACDGNFTAQHEEPGVKVVAVVGLSHVRAKTGVNGAEAVAPQFR
jgi:hypothetical protein